MTTIQGRGRPVPGERVSFSVGIRMADGVVRYAGAAMFAIEPDDPEAFAGQLDEQGRVWRYEHELAGLGSRPSSDVVIERPDPESVPETTSGFAFGAKFPGTCPVCERPIVVGQSVERTSRKRYVHEGCKP